MSINQYRKLYGDSDGAPGWDAIDARLKEVYGSEEPRHWGTLVSGSLGGPDPIDGISAYESQAGGISHPSISARMDTVNSSTSKKL